MEVVLGHWDTWDDDAIVMDRATGLFADPAKVHRLDHQGKFFKSRGPFTVPRSPQGHPVIIQAGQSGRGKAFASQWGELIFVIYPNLQVAKKNYADLKQTLAENGRDIAIAPAIYPVVAETQAEAEDKFAVIDALAKPIELAGAIVGGAELRLCVRSRSTSRSTPRSSNRSADFRPSATASCSSAASRTRPCAISSSSAAGQAEGAADLRRIGEDGRRQARGMVHRRRLRRLRRGCDPCAGHL